jgi:hypothetical protein
MGKRKRLEKELADLKLAIRLQLDIEGMPMKCLHVSPQLKLFCFANLGHEGDHCDQGIYWHQADYPVWVKREREVYGHS